MGDPTLVLDFQKLCIRVAEFLGVAYYGAAGDEAAQLPTGTHDLEKVKRIVNDGYRRFVLDNERGWNFLTVPLSITFGTGTVDSDNSRYYLPDDSAGTIVSPFTYDANQGLVSIKPKSEQEIRELKAGSNATGLPLFFCVRAIDTVETATGQRWEAIFWPTPSGTQTVTAAYKRYPDALVNNTDRPVSGFQHDNTVLEACLAAAELSVGDAAGPHEAAYQRELARSRKLDGRAAAPRIQDYGDKSDACSYSRRPKVYYGVDTYAGVPID